MKRLVAVVFAIGCSPAAEPPKPVVGVNNTKSQSPEVGLTMFAAVAGNAALISVATASGRAWGLGWQSALALGAALAMSSTAIVVKMMADRLELESEHGRRVMAVLLFQDLAVVPLLVLIPALGSSPEERCGGGRGPQDDGAARRPARRQPRKMRLG
jgi:hypothetical protein